MTIMDPEHKLICVQEKILAEEIVSLLLTKKFRTNLYVDDTGPITVGRVKKILKATITSIEEIENQCFLKLIVEGKK